MFLNSFIKNGIFKNYNLDNLQNLIKGLTLRRPLRKKLRMSWFFDVSKVKESSLLKSDLTVPLRILLRIF